MCTNIRLPHSVNNHGVTGSTFKNPSSSVSVGHPDVFSFATGGTLFGDGAGRPANGASGGGENDGGVGGGAMPARGGVKKSHPVSNTDDIAIVATIFILLSIESVLSLK